VYRVGLWKNIRKGRRKLCSHTIFKVGDGPKIRLWLDLWCGDMILKYAFLVLFDIACPKDASIVAHVEFFGGVI
jgi:hypothetical protein